MCVEERVRSPTAVADLSFGGLHGHGADANADGTTRPQVAGKGKGGGEGGDDDAPGAALSVLERERREKIDAEPRFYWADDAEPHLRRKLEIFNKYPSLKEYMRGDPATKYKVLFWISFQLLSLHLLQGASRSTWIFCCYTLSGSINHMMTLAVHELSHNLGAKGLLKNRLLAILANLPMGIPAAASFKRYHMEHHKYQGEDVVDVDVPTEVEGWFFRTRPRKVLWCFLQPLFYSLRPLMVNPKEPTRWEYINILCVVLFDALIVRAWGIGGLLYLVLGTLLGMGLHPVAGHFIAEHYVLHEGQETYSYYGPLNWLTFNVGYHNEHHDFANVSGRYLPAVRRIAAEYYDDMPHYHSWIKVIWDYVMDDGISPYSRYKRVTLENREIEDLRARGGLVK